MARPSRPQRPLRLRESSQPRLLASWQLALLWSVWLGVLVLLGLGTDSGSLSLVEFAAILTATGITVWACRHPQGLIGAPIFSAAELIGEFESRTNWPLVIVGTGLTLGGVAAGVKIVQDLGSGLTTVGGVLEDIALFFLEWFKEHLSNGTAGDVTHTRLYTLVILLPIGLVTLLFTLTPFLFRGRRFRVTKNGLVEILENGRWNLLEVEAFSRVTADGSTIDWRRQSGESPAFSLPQERVYSVERDVRVDRKILGEFFRELLGRSGFDLDPTEPGQDPARWQARRTRENR